MAVPLLDLKAQYQSIQPEIDDALLRVVHDQRFILGPEVAALETELAAYLGVEHAIGVSSGSDALLVALLALEIGPGDEVITSAYSFFATAGAIVRAGATPVFVDIDPRTYNLDPEQVARRIGPRTRALLPVHLFGRAAELDRLAELAPGLPMIEDAAQAIGAEHQGRRVGGIGRIGCFSFFPSKNLGGFGDGGLCTTNDGDLAARIRALRAHGQSGGRYLHSLVGGNFRLDALQAAVLRVKLRHLERWTEARRSHARRYRELFAGAGIQLTLPPEDPPDGRDVYNQFVIRVPDRDRLKRHLEAQGIGCAVYYPRGLHQQPCFSGLGYLEGAMPESEAASRETLALPVFPELSQTQLEEVVGQVLAGLRP
jgi:dTDP-4-amino-4,6-dideoxygalactose transaminase